MNNLYTFGCSYTEGFNIEHTMAYRDYKNYRGEFPKSWPEILSDSLKLNLINCGRGSAGNQEIFTTFCRNSKEFKKGDVIIVEWSFMERYRFASGNGKDDWLRFGPGRVDTNVILQSTNDEITVNRTLNPYKTEIYDFMTIMDRLSESVGFDLYYWTFIEDFIYALPKDKLEDKKFLLCDKIKDKHHHVFRILHDKGSETIEEETKGLVKDLHMGEKGHKLLAELFYEHIINFQKF